MRVKTRAAPATVSGVLSSKTTGWKTWEEDEKSSSGKPGDLLIEQPGCAEREENSSGDGLDCVAQN